MSFFHPDFCYLNTSHKVVTDSKGWNAGTCQRRSPFGINWRDFNLQKYRQGRVCSVRRLTFSIFFVANCVKKYLSWKLAKQPLIIKWICKIEPLEPLGKEFEELKKIASCRRKVCFNGCPTIAMQCIVYQSASQSIEYTYNGPQCTRWQYTFSWCKSHHQLVHEAETDNLG